jgi:hypothetical protein
MSSSPTQSTDLTSNEEIVSSYERIAHADAASTEGVPSGVTVAVMRRLIAPMPAGRRILELGSGSDGEADFLKSLVASVRRTDVTES